MRRFSSTSETSTGIEASGPTAKPLLEKNPADECIQPLAGNSVGRLTTVVADEPDILTLNDIVEGSFSP